MRAVEAMGAEGVWAHILHTSKTLGGGVARTVGALGAVGGGGGEGGGGLGTHWKPLNTSKTLARAAKRWG